MIDPNVDINYLGEFESIEDVWAAYPDGGQEGDYLFIGNQLYRWNKYDLSWGTKGIPETTTAQADINYLGEFDSIEDVWSAYPNGGQEGDYLLIGNQLYRWNKYDLSWISTGVTQTLTKDSQVFFGEVDVHDDLHVGGEAVFNGDVRVKGFLHATAVKQPNMGLFASLQALQTAYPKPEVGMWATVGNTIPSPIYRCDVEGVWRATGEVGGVDRVELNDYYTKREADELMEDFHEIISEETYQGLEKKEEKLYFIYE
jgi:hypothetical protein